MRLHVFTVYDKAVGAFLQPFYCRSQGEALRSFTEACNDPKNNFSRHSTDFVLMRLGEFDDNSGIFSCGEPTRVVSAAECIDIASDNPIGAAAAQVNGRMPM